MGDKIEPSAADKARAVWEATWRGEREPLGDKAAETLGKALERAAQWRTNADSTLPPRERERLKKIEGHANKLTQLLGEQSGTRDNIERYWPDSADPIGWPDLTRIIRELDTLYRDRRREADRREGSRVADIFIRSRNPTHSINTFSCGDYVFDDSGRRLIW